MEHSGKKKILVAFKTIQEGWELLTERFELTFPPEGRDFTGQELLERIPEYDVLLSVFDIPVPRELIEAGSRLQLIANYAVGYNNIDLESAQKKGIAVTNTPKAVVEPTADLALALLLDCTRRVGQWTQTMRQHQHSLAVNRWSNLGIGIQGKKLGIIGWGNIGAAFARRAQACGMQVLYNKRKRLPQEQEVALGISYASIGEILATADVVSLHTPLSTETRHLINRDALASMKPGAILINTGRGPLVDEQALVEALKSGKLAAAGLDVFENNDLPLPELYNLPNVSMTPHIGTQTYDARKDMLLELCENVIGFFDGRTDISRVV